MANHLEIASKNKRGIIHFVVIILVFFSSVALVSAILKFNESTSAGTAVTGPAAYPAAKSSSISAKNTYQYWVRVNGTYDLGCCGPSNPSKVTTSRVYKFTLNVDPDPRGYEAVVCSPSCSGPGSSVKWKGTALFSPYANGGYFLVDGERGGTYTNQDADRDGFSDLAEVYMKTDPTRSCPVNVTNSAWPVDINNDGKVDLFGDMYLVARKVGTAETRYDLNQDGKVNMKDVTIVAGYFGKSCPESPSVISGNNKVPLIAPLEPPIVPGQESSLTDKMSQKVNPSTSPSTSPSTGVAGTPVPSTQSTSVDSDNDGFSDTQEAYMGTNPKLACGTNAWPPDIDNNGTVDLFNDVFTLAYAYGSNNKRYDLNQDGKVDKADADIVSSYFGKTCSK